MIPATTTTFSTNKKYYYLLITCPSVAERVLFKMFEKLSENDVLILRIIQKTPCVEVLAKLLRRRGFPSIDENATGTRFKKCRRLYDSILQQCHTYYESRADQLKKVFHDSGNGNIGELLFTIKVNKEPLFMSSSSPSGSNPCPDITTAHMMRIFTAARNGNVSKLAILLKGVAIKCAEFPGSTIRSRINFSNIDLRQYKRKLANFLLDKKDWMDKSILHVAVESQSLDCIDLVLQYAQEANVKSSLLDARDAFGQTPLHLAVRRRYVEMTKKMIFEGSDLFLKNNVNLTPLEMIVHRLPVAIIFILDLAVTVSGELSGETLVLNIDFFIFLANPGPLMSGEERTRHWFDVGNRLRRHNPRSRSKQSRSCKSFGENDDKNKSFIIDIFEEKSEKESEDDDDTDTNSNEQLPSVSVISPILSTHSRSPSPISRSPRPNNRNNAGNNMKNNKKPVVSSSFTPRSSDDEEMMEMRMLGQTVLGQLWDRSWNILKHPVTQTFLDSKWKKMRYLLWVTYSFLRLVIYSLYIYLMYQVYFVHCPLKRTQPPLTCSWPIWTKTLLFSVSTFGVLLLIHTIAKSVNFWKITDIRRYFMKYPGPQAIIRFGFVAIVTFSCIPPFTDETLHTYHYVLATLGTLICSALILEVIGNSNFGFGIHSMYIHVYGRVIARFATVILTFVPLIAGFSVAFNILYPENEQFSSFFRSMFRIVIMLQGEFDFEDKLYHDLPHNSMNLSLHQTRDNNSDNDTMAEKYSLVGKLDENLLFWSGQILFSLLGCVLTLVLIDVFLGYTVGDINELQKQAEFVRRTQQIGQMHEAEIVVSAIIKVLRKVGIDASGVWNLFNVISPKRRNAERDDVVVSFQELDEERQSQFRSIFME